MREMPSGGGFSFKFFFFCFESFSIDGVSARASRTPHRIGVTWVAFSSTQTTVRYLHFCLPSSLENGTGSSVPPVALRLLITCFSFVCLFYVKKDRFINSSLARLLVRKLIGKTSELGWDRWVEPAWEPRSSYGNYGRERNITKRNPIDTTFVTIPRIDTGIHQHQLCMAVISWELRESQALGAICQNHLLTTERLSRRVHLISINFYYIVKIYACVLIEFWRHY